MTDRSDTLSEISTTAPKPLPNTGVVNEVNQPRWIAWLLNLINRIAFKDERGTQVANGTDVFGTIGSSDWERFTVNGVDRTVGSYTIPGKASTDEDWRPWNFTDQCLDFDVTIAGLVIRCDIELDYDPSATPDRLAISVEVAPPGEDASVAKGLGNWEEFEVVTGSVARSGGHQRLKPVTFARPIPAGAGRVRFWLKAEGGNLNNCDHPSITTERTNEGLVSY